MKNSQRTADANSEKLKTSPPRSETRQGRPLLPLVFNTELEVLTREIWRERDQTPTEKMKM